MPQYLNPTLPLALPVLPFDPKDLADVLGARTISCHHGKHHKAYIEKVNQLASDAGFENETLDTIIAATAQDKSLSTLHKNAQQVWNHNFQWLSLVGASDLSVAPEMRKLVKTCFGSVDEMAAQAAREGAAHMGSGWLWLVASNDKLDLITTHDDARPGKAESALLSVDLWEHAYYLDFQNKREEYIEALISKHWNWGFAQARLSALNS